MRSYGSRVDPKSNESTLIRDRKGHTDIEEKAIEDGNRVWNCVSTSQGTLGSTRSQKKVRKESSLEPSEGTWPY